MNRSRPRLHPLPLFLLAVVSFAVLAGCVPQVKRTPPHLPSPTPSATPLPSTPTPQLTSTPPAKDVPLLEYRLSGGIMGKNEIWQFFPDGRMVPNKGNVLLADPAAAAALADKLACTNFPSPGSSRDGSVCADCFEVTLTRFEEAQQCTLTFTLEQTAETAPEAKLYGLVLAYLAEGKPQ